MIFIFADDSRQEQPTREGMGPLVATGGFAIDADKAKSLETTLERVCDEFDFPDGEEFKWSPGPKLWMRKNLVDAERERFFNRVLDEARRHEVRVFVAVVDCEKQAATGAADPKQDATQLFLERVNNFLRTRNEDGVIIVDRPGGDRTSETKFLMECLETIRIGTKFVDFDRLAFNVVSTPSSLIRLLQLADFFTSCSLARIAGEKNYSPQFFRRFLGMFDQKDGRIGGVGVKLHPDYKYANLYHWLLHDKWYMKQSTGAQFPLRDRPYKHSEDVY